MPQKIKRKEVHEQDKRDEAKIASKKEKDLNGKKIKSTMRFPYLLTCSKQNLVYGTCIILIITTVA